MSYGQLVTIDHDITLDTSNLDERLDELQSAIDEVSGMDESKVQDLIDNTIDGRNLVSSDDVDVEDLERRVRDFDGLEERVDALENSDAPDTDDLVQRIGDLAGRLSDLERVNEQAIQVFNALVVVVGILTEAGRPGRSA